jgi:hypothetical protein
MRLYWPKELQRQQPNYALPDFKNKRSIRITLSI